MKNIKYLLMSVLAAGALFTACTKDSTYEAGEPDKASCYGVYVADEQDFETSGMIIISPDDDKELVYTICRNRTEGAVTVPLKISGDTDVLKISSVAFADGQAETTLTVAFPDMEESKEYPLTIAFDDPENDYVSKYSTNSLLNVTILIAGWNPVDAENVIVYKDQTYTGYCNYTDDLVASMYGIENLTYPVKVEVRSDTIDEDYPNGPNGLAGLYRIVDIYSEAHCPYDENPEGPDYGNWYDERKSSYVVIDATDPKKVTIEYSESGLDWGYSEIVIWSWADYYASSGKDASDYYGKIENGAITFPAEALLVGDEDGFYTGNGSGAFKLVLDHTLDVDYKVTLSNTEAIDGKLDIAAKFGKDVASIKYAIYEGTLDAKAVAAHIEAIDSEEEDSTEIEEEGVITVELEKTGTYTFVAAVYDSEGELQGEASLSFGYVAAGDEVPVIISASLIENRYADKTNTTENSLEAMIYGKDITGVEYGIYETSKVAYYDESELRELVSEKGTSLEAGDIAAINGNGYSFVITGLYAGTDYTLVLVATNSYEVKVVTADKTTDGEYNFLEHSFGWDDVFGAYKESFCGDWIMYGVDYFDDETEGRQPLNYVSIEDGGEIDDVDVLNISGLSLGYVEDDAQPWEYYGGLVYSLAMEPQVFEGKSTYYLDYFLFDSNTESAYSTLNESMMVGGFVDDSYIAFFDSEFYADYGAGANGYGISAYSDEDMTEDGYLGSLAIVYDLLLEDASLSAETLSAKASVKTISKSTLKSIAKDLRTPKNYVELRGRERAHSVIDSYLGGKTKHSLVNRAKNVVPTAVGDFATPANAKTSFKSGIPAAKKSGIKQKSNKVAKL